MNYLLPIDADIKDVEDLSFVLTARDILARLQAAGSVRILILDACRDNPIPQRLAKGRSTSVPRGLGPEPKTNGTFIAYSTQLDTIADDGNDRNSPFVKALLDHITAPGLDIRLLFADVRSDVVNRTGGAQTPETSDSLDGRFAFRKTEPVTSSLPSPSSPAAAASPQAVPEAAMVPVAPNTTVFPKFPTPAPGPSPRPLPAPGGRSKFVGGVACPDQRSNTCCPAGYVWDTQVRACGPASLFTTRTTTYLTPAPTAAPPKFVGAKAGCSAAVLPARRGCGRRPPPGYPLLEAGGSRPGPSPSRKTRRALPGGLVAIGWRWPAVTQKQAGRPEGHS
jgi:hypothetical protein